MLENISIEKLQAERTMSQEEVEERNEYYIDSIAHMITNANHRGHTQLIVNNAALRDLFRAGALGLNNSKTDLRSVIEIADMIIDFFTKHTDLEVSVNKTGINTPTPQVEIIFSWEVK